MTGALSMGICETDSSFLFLGADDGLYKWSNVKWERVTKVGNTDLVLSNVRDVLVTGNNCSEIYAATVNNGLWRITESEVTRLDENQSPPIPAVRSVTKRDKLLFVGTNGGMKIYDMDKRSWHNTDGTNYLITRQSQAGNRTYAAAWTFGVVFNDSCQLPDNCQWESKKIMPPENAFIRDVLGSPPEDDLWLLAATSNGIIYWDGNAWQNPALPPQPSGDVFALAESVDGEIAFAAVEGSGVWYSMAAGQDSVKGQVWSSLGKLLLPIIDLTVTDTGLYATTTTSGVYLWPLPNGSADK